MTKRVTRLKKAAELAVIGISALMIAIAFNWFLIPHQLLSGGLSGISMIVGYLTGGRISIIYLIANLPIAIWGLVKLGRTFIGYSVVCVGLTVWFMAAVPVKAIATDPILSAVFGGVLVGVSTGIALRVGGSTGGFDIVGSIMTRTHDFPLGTFLSGVNALIIFALGYFKGDWDLALASMLSMYITGRVVDLIHIRHIKVTAFIVTTQKEALMEQLRKLPRGFTMMQAEGGFSYRERTMLMTVTTRYELAELKKIVRACDPHAFVNVVATIGVMGEFRR